MFIISDVMRSVLSCSLIAILTVSVCSGVLGWLSLFWFLISLAPLGDSILTLLPNLKIDVISIAQSLLNVKTAKLSIEWNWKVTLLNEFLAVFPFRSFHRRSSPLCHWKQQEGCFLLLGPGQPSYWNDKRPQKTRERAAGDMEMWYMQKIAMKGWMDGGIDAEVDFNLGILLVQIFKWESPLAAFFVIFTHLPRSEML